MKDLITFVVNTTENVISKKLRFDFLCFPCLFGTKHCVDAIKICCRNKNLAIEMSFMHYPTFSGYKNGN